MQALEGLAEKMEGVVWLTRVGEISATYVSPSFEDFWGLSRDAALNGSMEWVDLLHPDDRERAIDALRAVGETGQFDETWRLMRPNGCTRWIRARSFLILDGAPGEPFVLGLTEDVTDRVEARRDADDAAGRLAEYFENTPIPAYMWRERDGHLRVERMNRAARVRWDGHVERLLGQTAEEWHAKTPDVVADLRKVLRDRVSFTREIDYRTELKGDRRLVVTYVPVPPDAVVAHVDDVTEAEEARRAWEEATERVARYFEYVPTPAYVWRAQGDDVILETANRAGMTATKGRIADHFGVSATSFYEDRPDIVEDLRRCLRGETFTREMRYELRTVAHESRDMVVTYVHVPPNGVAVHAVDVTDRKRIEAELRASHEAARGILDASTQPILLVDVEKRAVLAMNDALSRSLGVPAEEILGRDILPLFSRETAEVRLAAMRRVVSTGEPVQFEDERDGRFFRFRMYPLAGDGGRVNRVVVYAEDFTEERRAREELLESKARYEEAQRAAHLGHWTWDISSGSVSWSDEVFRIYGLAPQCRDLTSQVTMAYVHPDDRDLVREVATKASTSGGPFVADHRIVLDDGETRIVRVQGTFKIEPDGRRILVGTVLDITELKEAEAAILSREADLLALIEGAPDGICLTAAPGVIAACNTALGEIAGTTCDDMMGRHLTDYLIPGDRRRAYHKAEDILGGAPAEPGEYTVLRVDGSTVPVEIFSAAIDFRGEPALISTVRDVTKRRQAELELAQSHGLLRALTQHLENVREEERAQVAQDLHDELGSVLTALKIDLCEVQSRPDHVDPKLVTGMLELVDQAIEVGRRVTSRLRPGILDDLGLAAAVEWLGGDLEQRTGIKCIVALPEREPELPPPVATAMFRILQEALTNVIRHSGADEARITLEADAESIVLAVTDNGKGFDPARTARSSFGLLGMRERVQAFGGDIDIRSSMPGGTTIRVMLPLA